MDLSFLNNMFPGANDPNAMQKNLNMGLLGLSLMQKGQPSATPQSFGTGLLGVGFNMPSGTPIQGISQAAAQQGQNYIAQSILGGDPSQSQPQSQVPAMSDPTTYSSAASQLPADKTAMLQNLQQQAALAYPGNPTMQQVAITQAIHESGLMGHPSQLATRDNNLFGIKAAGTNGMDYLPTHEFVNGAMQTQQAGFGRNKTVADSFMQHRALLEHNQRYQPVINAQSPAQAFSALQSAGYATDPHYAQQLSKVYGRYVAPMYQQ